MIDIRDHGGNFGGNKESGGKFPIETLTPRQLSTICLGGGYCLPSSSNLISYPTAVYGLWQTSTNILKKSLYNESATLLGTINPVISFPLTINKVLPNHSGFYIVSIASPTTLYKIKNDVIVKIISIDSYDAIYIDDEIYISLNGSVLNIYSLDGVLLANITVTSGSLTCKKVAANQYLIGQIGSSSVKYYLLSKTSTGYVLTTSATNTSVTTFYEAYLTLIEKSKGEFF